MAIGSAGIASRIEKETGTTKPLNTFLGQYFYLCMALVMAVIVVSGFSRTVGANLLHANPSRPLLLWMHGAAFSTWVLFFFAQSLLVRVRKISVHRFLGWFGAGLATLMVALGLRVAVVMTRFDAVVLHQTGIDSFLSIPICDMTVFGTCVACAIYSRKRPEYHRRLLFMATCLLMDAPIARFDFFFYHNLFFPGVDFLIVLGAARDWWVAGRVHKVYLYALPPLIAWQSLAMYLWKVNPGWWQSITYAILGL